MAFQGNSVTIKEKNEQSFGYIYPQNSNIENLTDANTELHTLHSNNLLVRSKTYPPQEQVS